MEMNEHGSCLGVGVYFCFLCKEGGLVVQYKEDGMGDNCGGGSVSMKKKQDTEAFSCGAKHS